MKPEAGSTLRRVVIYCFLILPIFSLLNIAQVFGLSDEQKRIFDSGIYNFDFSPASSCGYSGGVSSGRRLSEGSKVYILGDSITNQSKTEIRAAMDTARYSVSSINADPGRAISLDTAGSNPTGLEAVAADSALISDSDAVVVALGTNSGTEDLSQQIPALITAIKSVRSGVSIFWVNLFYEAGSAETRNAVIVDQSSKLGFGIINTVGEGIELQSDGTHPTAVGNTAFATAIVNGLKSGGSAPLASGVGVGGFNPLSINYPAFPDEALVGQQITDYLKENKPRTPWLGVDASFGPWLLAEAKTRNINPMLVMTMGRQENGFGTSNSIHVRDYHNYFGMKGSTPIDIPGSDYRGFNSPTEGLRYMMDKLKENTQGAERGNYKDVVNYYEYQSVHQTGVIAYPGEPFGTQGPTGQDGYDSSMDVYVSWTTTDHPNNEYDGNLYNPGIYYTNAVELINTLLGTSLSDVPVRGGVLGCLTGGRSGKIDSSGYSFPLAPQTRAVGGISVGQTEPTHGDGTAAFDLFSTEDSADVYAIFGGTATNIARDYHGIPGCSSIQFLADDGFYYWYGHLKNVTITEGTPITAGQQIAQIADNRNFGRECIGSASHLHIDRGCVIDGVAQTGGRDECRDADFIPFLSSLYGTLEAR